jgi:hypothetical protein
VPGYFDYYFGPEDRGYLAEFPCPSYLCNATSSMDNTAGRLALSRLKVPQSGWTANIVLNVTAVGTSLTAGQNFAALFMAGVAGASPTLVAQSVDQTTNWGGTGVKPAQLNGGPYFLHAGIFYIGLWWNGGGAPTVLRQANTSSAGANAGVSAPNLIACTANTGLTTAAPATVGTQTVSGATLWVALDRIAGG